LHFHNPKGCISMRFSTRLLLLLWKAAFEFTSSVGN
jgi:hypothetical protein